jgi:hypothetical protein
MSLGNAFPQRSTVPDATEVCGVWTGAGAADMTQTTGDWSKGIVRIDQTATGKYTMYFSDVGQQVIGFDCSVASATGDGPLFVTYVNGTLSTANKTIDVEANTGAGTLTDIPATAKVMFNVKFAKQKP